MNQAKQHRLRFIDFLLDHYGKINRSSIEDYFGVSTPQASDDIAYYASARPDNIYYNKSKKVYERGLAFERWMP